MGRGGARGLSRRRLLRSVLTSLLRELAAHSGDEQGKPGVWRPRTDSGAREAKRSIRSDGTRRCDTADQLAASCWWRPRDSVLPVVLEVRPSRDVDTVVLGRRECPPMGHMRTVRQASASFECCRDSCFGLIGRHADVDVGPATPRLGRVEALERHVRVTSVPIDHVFFGPRLLYPRAAAQNGPTSLPASCATAMATTWTWEGSGSIRNFRASAEIWRASSTSRWLRAPYSPEADRTVTPSGRTSTSGKWPTTSATSAIAATNPAASANDPTRK